MNSDTFNRGASEGCWFENLVLLCMAYVLCVYNSGVRSYTEEYTEDFLTNSTGYGCPGDFSRISHGNAHFGNGHQ